MKYIFLVGVLALFCFACQPGYRVFLKNTSGKKITLITSPPLDPHINDLLFKKYDILVPMTIDTLEGVYLVPNNAQTVIYSHLYKHMGVVSKEHFPFNYFKIVNDKDTIQLNKDNYIDKLKKRDKNSYYIDVN